MKIGIEAICDVGTKEALEPLERLDEKGRCCGRKPIVYKHGGLTPMGLPHKFCPRCGTNYDIETGVEIYDTKGGLPTEAST